MKWGLKSKFDNVFDIRKEYCLYIQSMRKIQSGPFYAVKKGLILTQRSMFMRTIIQG